MISPPSREGLVAGRNPVHELLRARGRRVEELAILGEGRGPALQELLALARSMGVKVSYRTRDQLDAIAGTLQHQGVVARVAEASYLSLEELLQGSKGRGEPALFLALDQIQDPRNLGAILRTAEVTGVHGVLLPKRRSAGLTGAAARSAMGAVELMPVARETNLVHALERLKKQGIWIMGASASGGRAPWDVKMSGPVCVVLGGESEGLRPLVERTCDALLTVPMRGKIGSLSVSAAASAICYEILRQRCGKVGDGP